MKKVFLLFFIITSIELKSKPVLNNKKDLWITIFVHGSFAISPHISMKNLINVFLDKIENTIYYYSTEINRKDPFFYKNQAINEFGLKKIDLNKENDLSAAPTIALNFDKVSELAGYNHSNEYYTFGWSGMVSNKLRAKESAILYKALLKLVKETEEKGFNPKIRLIAYSHGGNLALQLGKIYKEKHEKEQFKIEELHLLGTPIQVETDSLICSPIFKKKYNWFSNGDSIQTKDFFSFKRFFSRKIFSPRKGFRLPDNLTQIQLKLSKFNPKKDCQKIDLFSTTDQKILKNYKRECFDPGHYELWFMGWTKLKCREQFPTYPLPAVTFIPFLTKYINESKDKSRNLVAHIQPCFDKVEIYPKDKKRDKQSHKLYKFIGKEKLNNMQKDALKFIPDEFNKNAYKQKVKDSIKIAKKEKAKMKKLLKLKRKSTT